MSRLRPKVVDARGKPVEPLLRPGIFGRGYNPHVSQSRLREVGERIRPTVISESRGLITIAVIVSLPFFFIPAVLLPTLVKGFGWYLIIVAAVVGAIGPIVMNLAMRILLAPRIVRACVEHGVCGSCAYELRGLEPDHTDGCVVCPECGSAWELPDVHATAARKNAT